MNTAEEKEAEKADHIETSTKKRVSRRAAVYYAAVLLITVLALIVLSYFASNRLNSQAEDACEQTYHQHHSELQ